MQVASKAGAVKAQKQARRTREGLWGRDPHRPRGRCMALGACVLPRSKRPVVLLGARAEKRPRAPRRGDVNRARRAGRERRGPAFTNRFLLLTWLAANGLTLERRHFGMGFQELRHLALLRRSEGEISLCLLGRTLTTDDAMRALSIDLPEGMAE